MLSEIFVSLILSIFIRSNNIMMKNVESNRIEFKEKLTNELEKEIVAFLNYKEGGLVYVGIDKHSNVVGLKDADDVQLRIKDRLKNNILPSCMGLFNG